MKSDIIRIYHISGWEGDANVFLGTVERPGEDVKLAFSSFDELRHILGPLAGKVISVKWGERQKSQNPKAGYFRSRMPRIRGDGTQFQVS